MVAPVFATIIPNQRRWVADLIAGRDADPALGAPTGQERSVHNKYLTLTVVFMMFYHQYQRCSRPLPTG